MKRFFYLTALFVFMSSLAFAQTGQFNWASSAGGSSSDYCYDSYTDNLGNTYVTGKFKSDPMDFGNGIQISPKGNYDVYVAKYDPTGAALWAVDAGSAGSSSPDEGDAITADAAGNVYVTGAFFGTAYFSDTDSLVSTGNFDVFIAKYDTDGNFVWAKQAYSTSGTQDKGTGIVADAAGNVYVTGYFGDDASDTLMYDGHELYTAGDRDMFVIKLDGSGNWVWGVSGGNVYKEEAKAIDLDENGDVYVTGHYDDTTGVFGTFILPYVDDNEIFVVKIDGSTGNYLWAQGIVGTGKDGPYGLYATDNGPDNGIVLVTGYFNDDLSIDTTSITSYGDDDIYLAAFDINGNFLEMEQFGGEGEDKGYSVKLVGDNIYIGGYSKSDFVAGQDTITNLGRKDAILIKYNGPSSQLEWVKNYGGNSDEYVTSIGVDGEGNIYPTGYVKSNPAVFDPINISPAGSYDAWVGRMDHSSDANCSLFFTEYVEGSGNNKALEIYNNSDDPVDLTQYVILGSYNGSGWSNVCNFPDGSVVAPHDVWVIVNSGADIIDFGVADEVLAYNDSSYVVGFNGDDARAIAQINGTDTTIYDVIGIATEDPGSGWDVAGVSNATKDHTLRRKLSVSQGNTDWAASAGTDADNSEWEVLDKNTVDGLGWYEPPTTVNVTFQVDMSVQAMLGNFNPDSNVVTIPGDFDNWLNEPPANTDKVMEDSDGDLVYTKTFELDPNTTYQYKYNIGLGWDGNDELQGQPNRVIETGTTDSTLTPVFFNNQSIGGTAIVTFEVDMSLQAASGFNPATQDVYVAGSFTDWQNSPIMMSDADGDTTYSVTVDTLTGGEALYFKFIYGDQGSTEYTWETVDNREFIPIDGENTYSAYWDNVEPGQNFADGNITFNVDMSVMNEVGIFDNAIDSVQVRGSFNGWGNSDPMDQNFLDPNQWFRTVSFTQEVVGTDEVYKFYANLADTATMWTDGWERPFSQGGGNRDVTFEGTTDQTVDPVYYDDVNPDLVIPAGTTVNITFSVDMTDAANDQIQVPTFNPATDTVWWIAEEPAFTYLMGWVDRDDMREVQLTDPDGDMVYTVTLSITGPAWNGFEYRYGFSNGDFHAEPAGFSDFAYRVRYIGMTGARTFIQPWDAPQDHWTPQEDKSDQWEAEPATTGVGDEAGTVKRFELSQNYPNPFNPTTTIKFAIPQSSEVTLNVYNLLGQKVATLINAQMNAGSYEYHFDASKLGSGVYFYSIKAGKYSDTKKMILMK